MVPRDLTASWLAAGQVVMVFLVAKKNLPKRDGWIVGYLVRYSQ